MRHFLILTAVLFFAGCVTQKKYNELLAEKVQLEGELGMSRDSLIVAENDMGNLEQTLVGLKEDTTQLGQAKRETEAELSDLQSQYDELDTYYNNLLNNSGKLSKDLEEQKSQLMALKDDLTATQLKNDALAADLAEREKKVQELEDILRRKDEAVQSLKSKITSALLNFKESDLTVEMKNGKVYISLAEQLLFNSGSVIVDSKGAGALKQLAAAIKDQTDISIMVEGHTDDVPIGNVSKYMKDNWDLSVMRATSIVRILTDAGVASGQITAGGRGEFSPVGDNETPEGRSKNRRTEIIITPDLGELFSILESNE